MNLLSLSANVFIEELDQNAAPPGKASGCASPGPAPAVLARLRPRFCWRKRKRHRETWS